MSVSVWVKEILLMNMSDKNWLGVEGKNLKKVILGLHVEKNNIERHADYLTLIFSYKWTLLIELAIFSYLFIKPCYTGLHMRLSY